MFVLILLLKLTTENIIETGNSTIISTIYNILADLYSCQETFENTKGVNIIRKLKKDREYNGQKKKRQKDRQRSTKHYT